MMVSMNPPHTPYNSLECCTEEDFTVEFPAVNERCDLRVLLNGTTDSAVGLKGNVTVRTKRAVK